MEFKLEDPEKRDRKRAELLGKVLDLKDVVAYQDGTVASRMLVNRKAGSITVFSFDEDEGLSEHMAPFDAGVTILDGECEVFSNDVPVACPGCGVTVYNDLLSCVQWCTSAKQCVGEAVHRKLVREREG